MQGEARLDAGGLARAFEANNFLFAVEIGDAVAGANPGAGVAIDLIVIGPKRAVLHCAFRQLLADDLFNVFESEHFRPATAAFEVGL